MIDQLNWIVKFFTSILHVLTALLKFAYTSIMAIIRFVADLPIYINFLSTSVAILPSFLIPFAMVGIFLPLILMLINRKFGGD